MAEQKSGKRSGPAPRFDPDKFEYIHQVGGIQTALLESPIGSGQFSKVAMFNTGSGLRFTVAIDRGGDIVDASFNEHNLAFLTPNGYKQPSHAYHINPLDWLFSWPGGLLTTCGPIWMGHPRNENGENVNLHGHHSNTPAAIEMLFNPDPHRGRQEMMLSMVIRDSRMFGPTIEVRRQIQCTLGVPQIILYDQVTNRGNVPCPHHYLYHINFGYPLLDEGTRFIYRGKTRYFPFDTQINDAQLNKLKTATGPIAEHRGTGERGLVVECEPGKDGMCHTGIINKKLNLAVEIVYDPDDLPRLINWQHFGPGGSYATGIEPFSGTLFGKAKDPHPGAEQFLKPGETKRYQLKLNVLNKRDELAAFMKYDGPIKQ